MGGSRHASRDRIVWIAVAVGSVWTIGVGAARMRDGIGLADLLALVVPLGLIVVCAVMALSLRTMRAEAQALHAERDALRGALTQLEADQTRSAPPVAPRAAPERPAAPAPAPVPVPLPAPAADTIPPDPPADSQARLPLDPDRAPAPHLTLPDLIRALHFPETPQDRDGLVALSKALKDHRARLVVQAAQDMLTLLSQDGIYMDDLPPSPAPADLWRRFAEGDRAPEVMAIAAMHDPAAIARCRTRLQDNTVYRDAAHHFLRRFDQTLGDLVPRLNEDGIAALVATRSARAFTLVGRAALVFGPDPVDTPAP